MVVLQVINPNMATCRAAAQKWKNPFLTHSGLFLRHVWPSFQILSKSVEKQTSYVVALSAQLAPEDNYEKDNVRNSQFLNISCLNDILIAIVMPSGIF